jgi:hypothetical protein
MAGDFILLKRTYPTSKHDRFCDGYDYILENTTSKERRKWSIQKKKLQKIIKEGEKYMYIVGKENGEFRYLSVCFPNYEIIRKYIFELNDE